MNELISQLYTISCSQYQTLKYRRRVKKYYAELHRIKEEYTKCNFSHSCIERLSNMLLLLNYQSHMKCYNMIEMKIASKSNQSLCHAIDLMIIKCKKILHVHCAKHRRHTL